MPSATVSPLEGVTINFQGVGPSPAGFKVLEASISASPSLATYSASEELESGNATKETFEYLNQLLDDDDGEEEVTSSGISSSSSSDSENTSCSVSPSFSDPPSIPSSVGSLKYCQCLSFRSSASLSSRDEDEEQDDD